MDSSEFERAKIIYWGMMVRCYNPTVISYRDFGGRGIFVCTEWRDSFERFLEEMGYPPPSSTLHLSTGTFTYCRKNCDWRVRKWTKTFINHDEQNLHISEWSKITGLPKALIYCRIYDLGWSAEKALTTPLNPRTRLITFNDETRSLAQWAIITGMDANTLAYRLKAGWSVEESLTLDLQKRRKKQATRESPR